MDLIAAISITVMATATPLIFAAVGEVVAERSGVLNLSVEGMMAIGAVSAFAAAHLTGSTALGVLAGGVAGMATAALFSFLSLWLRSDQVPTGLALTLFGLGLSALLGHGLVGIALEHQPRGIPFLEDIPLLGTVLFGHDALVYLALLFALATWWVMERTRAGLVVKATGENHAAAHALGHKVLLTRFACVLYGGIGAGIGGAYLSVFHTPLWAQDLTAGRGWIAIALVVFASWRILRSVGGALLFGGLSVLALYQQGKLIDLPSQYLAMLPYLITIAVLVVFSARAKGDLAAPANLGVKFERN